MNIFSSVSINHEGMFRSLENRKLTPNFKGAILWLGDGPIIRSFHIVINIFDFLWHACNHGFLGDDSELISRNCYFTSVPDWRQTKQPILNAMHAHLPTCIKREPSKKSSHYQAQSPKKSKAKRPPPFEEELQDFNFCSTLPPASSAISPYALVAKSPFVLHTAA